MATRLHARVGTIRQLEILLAVREEGSIKAAAERLHLTQPTVSMQLKKLSDAIDMPIFERAGSRRITTEAGQALIDTAAEVLQQFSLLEERLAALRGLRAGTLRLAVVTTSKYFIPHLLGPFCERYPGVEVTFHVGNRQQIIQRLEAGQDDLYVFSHPPEDVDIDTMDFLPNPLVAVVPERHPLVGEEAPVALQRFLSFPFISREQGSGTRHAIAQHMRDQGVTLRPRMTIESNEAIKHAVMSGLGVTILSAHTLSFGGHSGLVTVPVDSLPIQAHWYLVKHPRRQLPPVAQAFQDYLADEGRGMVLDELAHSASGWRIQ